MKKIILIFIILIGLVLRLVWLDKRPLGFTWDEAALGYNAYSLLKTGRDEHQQILPIVFKSFGDFKPGLYIYYTVPSVALLGLTEFATRLPSAILGTLTILGIYLLVRYCFDQKTAVAACILIAINPWLIHFSRGAWEANLALFLTVIGTVLFIKKRWRLAALFFGLTFWSYQGAKMITPFLVLLLLILNKSWTDLRKLVIPGIVLGIFLTPILLGLSTQGGRLKVFNVFSYVRPRERVQEILRQDDTQTLNPIYYLFHSEFLDQIRGVVQRYLNHFSPRFLFFEGDWSNARHSTAYYGYFHYLELVTFLIGIVVLIRSKNHSAWLVLGWLILAPIPAALSRDIISGVRVLPLSIPLIIISALGLSKIFQYKLFSFLFGLVLVFNLVYFLDLSLVHDPYYSGKYWSVAYKTAIQIVNEHISDYNQIVFTNTLGQPYIYVLFYNKIDPRDFWGNTQYLASESGDVSEVIAWDKYLFQKIYWPRQRGDSSTLFVGDQWELPEQDMNPTNLVRLGEVSYPDGSHALRIVGLQ